MAPISAGVVTPPAIPRPASQISSHPEPDHCAGLLLFQVTPRAVDLR
jgi:hypothetical protein